MVSYRRLLSCPLAISILNFSASAQKEHAEEANVLHHLFHGLWEEPATTATALPTGSEPLIRSLIIEQSASASEYVVVGTAAPAPEQPKIHARVIEDPSRAMDVISVTATSPQEITVISPSTTLVGGSIGGFTRPDLQQFVPPSAVSSIAVALPAINRTVASEDHYTTDIV
jgi:hypothetical protein